MPLPVMTPAQLDIALAEYDKSRPDIKRRVVARIVMKLVANEELVRTLGLLIDYLRAGRSPGQELLDTIRELKEALK